MAERIDESAMVLAHELGVEYSDVLYVPERVAGDSHPSFETEPIEVRAYAAGAFRQRNRVATACCTRGRRRFWALGLLGRSLEARTCTCLGWFQRVVRALQRRRGPCARRVRLRAVLR